jgi:aryl-alcohol dehydrogenase-like predicted oxidoreductase
MKDIQKRPLGRTGEQVSMIGLGGGHIGMQEVTSREAVRLMHYAIDNGITFFDNAWEYNEGRSESLMGQAISDRREKVFLMTKVCARDARGAERQLNESLRRLQTDRIDLWQFHEVNYGNDPEWIFAPGGAAETAQKALEGGKVRYVGFTGHKDPAYLAKMLEYDFPWAAAQMPINVLDASFRSFQGQLLPALKERGIACLGMKSLGGNAELVLQAGIPVEVCLRFALSQDIASLVCGMENQGVMDQNIEIARSFQSMTEQEQAELLENTRETAGDGRCELYKVTQNYDSEVHRNQHFFP